MGNSRGRYIHINATQRCQFLYITMLIIVVIVVITDAAQFILVSSS